MTDNQFELEQRKKDEARLAAMQALAAPDLSKVPGLQYGLVEDFQAPLAANVPPPPEESIEVPIPAAAKAQVAAALKPKPKAKPAPQPPPAVSGPLPMVSRAPRAINSTELDNLAPGQMPEGYTPPSPKADAKAQPSKSTFPEAPTFDEAAAQKSLDNAELMARFGHVMDSVSSVGLNGRLDNSKLWDSFRTQAKDKDTAARKAFDVQKGEWIEKSKSDPTSSLSATAQQQVRDYYPDVAAKLGEDGLKRISAASLEKIIPGMREQLNKDAELLLRRQSNEASEKNQAATLAESARHNRASENLTAQGQRNELIKAQLTATDKDKKAGKLDPQTQRDLSGREALLKSIKEKAKQLRDWTDQYGTTEWFGEGNNEQRAALMASLSQDLAKLDNPSSEPNDAVIEAKRAQIGEPGAWKTKKTALGLIDRTVKDAESKVNNYRTAAGVDALPVAGSQQDQEALAWARSNPNDPRAKKILEMHGGQ